MNWIKSFDLFLFFVSKKLSGTPQYATTRDGGRRPALPRQFLRLRRGDEALSETLDTLVNHYSRLGPPYCSNYPIYYSSRLALGLVGAGRGE